MEYLNGSYIISDLTSGKGYHIFPSIPNRDLEEIWKYVRISFSENFSLNYIPKKKEIINFHNLKHNQSTKFNLSVLDRTLNKDFASKLSNQKWLIKICKILDLVPADVHSIGHATFTWRLTRPNSDNDFRPLHRDSWFRLNNKESKIIDDKKNTHIQTVKIWIALNVVLGKSGLLIAPHSQKSSKPGFSVVKSDGYLKPLINSHEEIPKMDIANTPSGSYILFGEDLIHGGAPNTSDECRISLEIPLGPRNYKANPYSRY